ncbi:uncharacterized protein LOC113335266 [Papaver somniferum]|uniref:uncharacterized protein LOC113335266 n=1 Tax=Papaver somniferum TaxID=3469 RepID=UPI000E6FC2F9|nr:uncharacterized protein LOC113335266 [Papaver somniferum]XP_026437154.1 uncharacterized protein LOC113335266 [Papaver somniferum]XP_026437155.1 uncharacterized protein LOC113335266 [Papaver somniferum]XP_026437156.1 uncharacterized protein LOC113335266 [Papaver somniferum]XP_026437157.1 uncharacterized protein LOC113335266 [Papaver somniferum]XP_026437158.1 uncharacterized protein LOC113335266 [Papaver somniferum]XP_026437159.1 uncharacterized protein LOC113335266 [Papaver somniferum]
MVMMKNTHPWLNRINLVDDASMSLATASSLAYGLEKKDNRTFLVFDLDGGIFDVSGCVLWRQLSGMVDESPAQEASISAFTGESSDSIVDVNVKTLDSQIYTFRVEKIIVDAVLNSIGLGSQIPMGATNTSSSVPLSDILLAEFGVALAV